MTPCIKKCKKDDNGICTGCHRTLDEITSWKKLSLEEKMVIMNRIENKISLKESKNKV
jgi:predicted Fe-S protein YdhL (DUF1289 family)